MKVFLEEQKFQPLLFVGLAMALIVTISVMLKDIDKLTNGSISELLGAISGVLIVLAVVVLFLFLKLKTRIDENGVQYQFLPFQTSYRVIKWNEISNLYIRKYDAISEFGGWGYKFSFRKKTGKAFTTKGSVGLQLELKNGLKILIGTQKKDELQRVITHYKNKEAIETI